MTRTQAPGGPWSRIPRVCVPAIATFTYFAGCDTARVDPRLTSGSCFECEIVIEETWATNVRDPNVLDVGTFVEWGDSVWTMQGFAGHRLIAYSLASGESRLIDREGEGPGEFRDVRAGFLDHAGDTLVVAEVARVSLLGPGGAFARSFTPPVPIAARSMGKTPEGDFIAAAPYSLEGSDEVNRLHRIDRNGLLLSSFGGPAQGLSPRMFPGEADTTVWLLTKLEDGVRLELWDISAEERLRLLEVKPDWWISPTRTPEQMERDASLGRVRRIPSSASTGLHADGILWISVSHSPADPAPFDGSAYDPVTRYDSVILAIDPESGEVLKGTVLTDRHATGFTRSGLLATYELDRAGHPRLRLHDLRLIRPD